MNYRPAALCLVLFSVLYATDAPAANLPESCVDLEQKVDDLQTRVERLQKERNSEKKAEDKREAVEDLAQMQGGGAAAANIAQLKKVLEEQDNASNAEKKGNIGGMSGEFATAQSDLAKAQNDLALCRWQQGSGSSSAGANLETPRAPSSNPTSGDSNADKGFRDF